MKRNDLAMGITVLASAALFLTGCQSGSAAGDANGPVIEAGKLAESIREKYEEKYEYTEPLRGIARDEWLDLQMGFDIRNGEFTEYTMIADVFQDAELTQRLGARFEWDEETQVLSITPPRGTVAGI